jgi:predicted HD phosphohydrolase
MKDGTKEDWAIIGRHFGPEHGGFAVDRLTPRLQAAPLALEDGRDEDSVVCALLHDIGDVLAPINHPEIGAAMVRPYVSEKLHWIMAHHGIFQGYYFWHHIGMDRDAREQFRGHEFFDDCAEFCELYDQAAFDPQRETLPLEAFEPLLRRVLAPPAVAMPAGTAAE